MLLADLQDLTQSEAADPLHETIAALFAAQAAHTPEAIALVADDRALSYREVDEQANRLARHLQTLGVGPETLVGVAMGRSEAVVISLLAILKAGGAYVPLDPSFPKERLAWMIEDSEMQVILTTAALRGQLPPNASHIVEVDSQASNLALYSSHAVASKATGRNLAYVMYTSGSTGKPKGVMIENRNVVNFFAGMDEALGAAPGVWLAVTSISFDISVLELLWTLTRGFKVVVHGDGGMDTIADEIHRNEVTHLQMTPSLARMLTLDLRAFASLGRLKYLLLGGEAVPASLVRKVNRVFVGQIYNMYGPTETTIWSTTYRVEEPGNTIPIGRPIVNTQIHLLDSNLNPVSEGEIGELFIGGDGVARGYWKRPDLTSGRFLALPSLSLSPIYRTGDLARFLTDGNIEFLGRADFQVKIRGHRIELGEIEALLEQCPGVRQAVVVVREDKVDDMRLAAYLVADATGPESTTALRMALASKLPEYMIPAAFAFLDELPLTDNGKVDRKALLKIPLPSPTMNAVVSRPASEIELIVAAAWQDALGVTSVGFDENFFDLGAHSLTVAEVQARLQEVLGREIPILDLFQYSTVSTLAMHLPGTKKPAQASDRALRRRMARLS